MVDFFQTADEAVSHIQNGDVVAVSGFGLAGQPLELVEALIRTGVTDLTIVANNAGNGDTGLAKLLANKAVSKVICSFPRQIDSHIFDALYRAGEIELELVPQGTLAERLRAAGSGIAGFFTKTAASTPLAEGKETRVFDGEKFVLERSLPVDVALIKAHQVDMFGNLKYRKTARNFGPIMAMAARNTVVEAESISQHQAINPEHVVTPSIFVHRVVHVPRRKVRDAQ